MVCSMKRGPLHPVLYMYKERSILSPLTIQGYCEPFQIWIHTENRIQLDFYLLGLNAKQSMISQYTALLGFGAQT